MSKPTSPLSNPRIRKPIIIIGCARSATTLMGNLFSMHPDVAFWHEPRPIWMYGNAYRTHYELTADDLTPRIAKHIDRQFGKFLQKSGKSRFGEKTPSNCFRLPFIYALYPDCRVVNIIRDGRKVVRSILQIEKRPPRPGKLRKRLQQTPFWEWPAYVPMFFRTFWRTRVMGKSTRYWGPKPKGWQQWQELPRYLMVAEQWRATVEASIRDGRELPSENYLEIRYENLIKQPIDVLREILRFTELSEDQAMLDHAGQRIDPNRTHKWKGVLTDEQEREIEERLKPTLARLGYLDESESIPAETGVPAEQRNQ